MKYTKIQWCHSTVNPVMGCHGCELWMPGTALVPEFGKLAAWAGRNTPEARSEVAKILRGRTTAEIYRDREILADELDLRLQLGPVARGAVVDLIRRRCKCYAGQLGTMRAGHKGYADRFDEPKLFSGRMALAAKWGSPAPREIQDKPWLTGYPRLVFVSDMGDALSSNVPFDYLDQEIVGIVSSPAGQRHVWLWLSKRPERMAAFGKWLQDRGGHWPANLVAMTTVTSSRHASRVDALRQVPSLFKALSAEPLFEPVKLNLKAIDWVIVGGGSDTLAEPFFVEWALDLERQCKAVSAAFFLKQLGRNPFYQGKPLLLSHSHGGDWNEWPAEWRVRRLPERLWEMTARWNG